MYIYTERGCERAGGSGREVDSGRAGGGGAVDSGREAGGAGGGGREVAGLPLTWLSALVYRGTVLLSSARVSSATAEVSRASRVSARSMSALRIAAETAPRPCAASASSTPG